MYLEQKSSHHIIWADNADHSSLLIWNVAKHKDMSRSIGLINDVDSRSNYQLTSVSTLSETIQGGNESVEEENAKAEQLLLDPLGDTPLKLFEVTLMKLRS